MKLTPTFLDGVVLAANASHRVPTVFDCHNCVLERALLLNTTNDWYSPSPQAWASPRAHRMFAPSWIPRRMVTGTADVLRALVRNIARDNPAAPILVCPSWLTNLLQSDVEGVAHELSIELARQVVVIPRHSSDDDWIDGIRGYQKALWNLETSGAPRRAVRGFCLHRREGDELGNVGELQRLWNLLGVPSAEWHAIGSPLAAEGDAGPQVLFPIGASPAEPIRDGDVRLPSLPIGVQATSAFVRRLGEAFGAGARAEELVAQDLFPVVANASAGTAGMVIGDPWTAQGLAQALRELGMDVPLLVVLRRAGAPGVAQAALEQSAGEVWVDPDYHDVEAWILRHAGLGLCHVVVGAGVVRDAAEKARIPYVEVGAPHQLQHFSAPAPYMGFAGLRVLADRAVQAMFEGEYRASVAAARRAPQA
jgi:nitrogenase molybdenum-iron protein alpha/beta subunit